MEDILIEKDKTDFALVPKEGSLEIESLSDYLEGLYAVLCKVDSSFVSSQRLLQWAEQTAMKSATGATSEKKEKGSDSPFWLDMLATVSGMDIALNAYNSIVDTRRRKGELRELLKMKQKVAAEQLEYVKKAVKQFRPVVDMCEGDFRRMTVGSCVPAESDVRELRTATANMRRVLVLFSLLLYAEAELAAWHGGLQDSDMPEPNEYDANAHIVCRLLRLDDNELLQEGREKEKCPGEETVAVADKGLLAYVLLRNAENIDNVKSSVVQRWSKMGAMEISGMMNDYMEEKERLLKRGDLAMVYRMGGLLLIAVYVYLLFWWAEFTLWLRIPLFLLSVPFVLWFALRRGKKAKEKFRKKLEDNKNKLIAQLREMAGWRQRRCKTKDTGYLKSMLDAFVDDPLAWL